MISVYVINGCGTFHLLSLCCCVFTATSSWFSSKHNLPEPGTLVTGTQAIIKDSLSYLHLLNIAISLSATHVLWSLPCDSALLRTLPCRANSLTREQLLLPFISPQARHWSTFNSSFRCWRCCRCFCFIHSAPGSKKMSCHQEELGCISYGMFHRWIFGVCNDLFLTSFFVCHCHSMLSFASFSYCLSLLSLRCWKNWSRDTSPSQERQASAHNLHLPEPHRPVPLWTTWHSQQDQPCSCTGLGSRVNEGRRPQIRRPHHLTVCCSCCELVTKTWLVSSGNSCSLVKSLCLCPSWRFQTWIP